MSKLSKHVRRVYNLETASLLTKSPWPKQVLRGSRARGMAFERAVGKHLVFLTQTVLPRFLLHSGQWFHFQDMNGPGNAQADHYLLSPEMVILIECKLKQNTSGEDQLLHLYRPLLEHIYKRPVFTVQAFRHWRFRPNKYEIKCPSELLHYPRDGVFMWQYLS